MTETWPSNDPGAPIDRDRQIELMSTAKERIKADLDYWLSFPEVQEALRRRAKASPMTIDISKFVQVPVLKWIGGASYARSEDTLFGRYEVERLASDSEWFLSCGRWEGGVHPSLDAAKAAAQADYAARKLAGLTPTPALVALISKRHKLPT